ncbi:MAG: glycosyltransferase family 2 protein, partial [Parcubacteria group bacterium]
ETPWCSGAAQLINRRALQRSGLFDEHFFMYCEDVDLSWRMWAKGYRCIYEPRAKVWHEQGFTCNKGGQKDFYLGMRNGLMLRLLYGGWGKYTHHIFKMLKLALLDRHTDLIGRKLVLRALVTHTKHLVHLLRRRRDLRHSASHWAIRFYGWDYHPLR